MKKTYFVYLSEKALASYSSNKVLQLFISNGGYIRCSAFAQNGSLISVKSLCNFPDGAAPASLEIQQFDVLAVVSYAEETQNLGFQIDKRFQKNPDPLK